MEIIKSPWANRFKELILSTKKEFIFTSPFIKNSAAILLMNSINKDVNIKGIISFRLQNFASGASDFEAIEMLWKNKASLKSIQKLHSKVYIFDESTAVISSANLTPSGLAGNVEIGILVKEKKVVISLKEHIEFLMKKDNVREIDEEILTKSAKILGAIPKMDNRDILSGLEKAEKSLWDFDKPEIQDEDILRIDVVSIINGLTGWEKDVFKCLVEIKKDIIYLNDVYEFEEKLSKIHPDNKNIRPKIRQQLQELRDLGLLEFFPEGGKYKRLWIQ